MAEKLFSTNELANVLKISTRTIRRWKQSGKLCPRKQKLGQDYYEAGDIRTFLRTIRTATDTIRTRIRTLDELIDRTIRTDDRTLGHKSNDSLGQLGHKSNDSLGQLGHKSNDSLGQLGHENGTSEHENAQTRNQNAQNDNKNAQNDNKNAQTETANRKRKLNYDELKEKAKTFFGEYLKNKGIDISRHFHCINPAHNDSTPSMIYNADNHTAHCFGCGKTYDIFNAFSEDTGIDLNDKRLFDIVYEWCGIANQKPLQKKIQNKVKPLVDLTPYFNACQKYINDVDFIDYMKSRNLYDLDLIKNFHIGYDFNCRCVVIPHGKYFCTRRYIKTWMDKNGKEHRYKYLSGADMQLFNEKALRNEVVFITEGTIDALSIIKVGGNAVAVGGAFNFNKTLLPILKSIRNKPKFIILFDEDSAGLEASAQLKSALNVSGFSTIEKFLPKLENVDKTDANLLLQRDEAALKKFVTDSIVEATELKNQSVQEKQSAIKMPKINLTTKDAVPSCPIDLDLPKQFRYTEQGIFYRKKNNLILAFGTPVVITKCFVNVDEGRTEKLEVAFLVNDKWITKIVDRTTLYDSRKIVTLGDFGLDVSSSSAKYAVEFIQYLVKDNRRKIPIITAYTKMGWHNDKLDKFITPYDSNDYIVDSNKNTFSSAITQAGSFEEWKKAYKEVKKYPLVRFNVACSLAVPLLNITHCRNFSLYTWANSTAGKTISALFAASAWGNHKEMVRNFNLTTNAVEGIAVENNDFPLFIDEKQLASKNFEAAKALMIIGNGVNKGRMKKDGTMQPNKYFRTIAIMTGEEPLSNDSDTQGGFTRSLQIHCDKKLLPDELASQLYELVDEHYGHAGKFFLEKLLNEDRKVIKALYKSICYEFKNYDLTMNANDLKLDDHIRYLAIACLTDALANHYFFNIPLVDSLIYAYKLGITIIDTLQTKKEISDVERAWDWTLGWISANRNHFELTDKEFVTPPYYGKKTFDSEGKDYLYINNQIFKTALEKEGNFNYKKIIHEFVRANYIKAENRTENDRNKPTPTVACRINGILTRCIKIPIEFLEGK